jgi:hypothetical protein
MLSERERRALLEIEQTMRAEEPDLAGSLTHMDPDPRRPRRRLDAVVLLSAATALLCLCVGAVGSGMLTVVFGTIVLGIRWWRFPPRSTRTPAWVRARP